jgi:hypothetical protein
MNGSGYFCLPIGYVERRTRHRTVVIRSHDIQRRLLDADLTGNSERAASAALAIHVQKLGSTVDPPDLAFHALTFADRHALIARLCIEEHWPEVVAVATCGECRISLEMSLDLRTIQLHPHDPRRPIILRSGAEQHRLRLPTPEDMEAAADGIDLVAACINCQREEALPWVEQAELMMSKYDPLGQIELSGTCTNCSTTVGAACNLVDSWLCRLQKRAVELIDDVHALALHYHWAEHEIVALPPARRAAYIGLCSET